MVGPIVAGIARKILSGILNASYRAFWKEIFEAIEKAEKDFIGGNIKKDWVLLKILDFIQKKRGKKLNRIQTWAIKKFIGIIINNIIDDLNKKDGKNWAQFAIDLEIRLNEKLKIIDPLPL